MTVDIEYPTYLEMMDSILSLIKMNDFEGLNSKRQWGLLKCLRGILKKQCGITVDVKVDSLGDYYLKRRPDRGTP